MNESDSQSANHDVPRDAAARPTAHEIATDAIRYWEPRRLFYNSVLAAIVIGYAVAWWPETRETVTFERALIVFMLAVLANLFYCAAYIVDIFAQFSDFRELWRRWRWLLLAIGTVFAAILTRFSVLGFLNQYNTQ